MLNDEKRGIEEAYTVAGNSSNLRVEADVCSDAELLIAAGWSDSRVGISLLRLRSEWDKAEKPRKPTASQIDALKTVQPKALHIKAENSETGFRVKHLTEKDRHEMARREAQDWYMREMAKLVNKLKSLPAVRDQLVKYVPKWGIAEAGVKVPAVIAYWLDQTCQHCHGLKFLQLSGTPSLSAKACRPCGGTGVAPVPHGQDGRRVANYMDECLQKGRGSIQRNVSLYRTASLHKRAPATAVAQA